MASEAHGRGPLRLLLSWAVFLGAGYNAGPCPGAAPVSPGRVQFLCLPDHGDPAHAGVVRLRDAAGTPVPWARLALKTVTLTRSTAPAHGLRRLQFVVDGYPGEVQLDTARGINALPMLYRVVEDGATRRLRARYAGRHVWCYPGTVTDYATVDPADPSAPGETENDLSIGYRVSNVLRVRGLPRSRPLGVQMGAIGGDRQSNYSFRDPLVILLDRVTFDDRWRSQSDGGFFESETVNGKPYPPPPAAPLSGNKYENVYAEFAGAWDLERAFSLVPPFRSRPSPHLRRAVLRQEVVPGMTPDMVAWTIGWPGQRGTVAHLRTESEWQYDNLPPFHFIVHFKKGRVTSAAPDGTLP